MIFPQAKLTALNEPKRVSSRMKQPGIILNVITPLLLGVLLLYGYQKNKRKPEDIGLGKGTSHYMPRVGGFPIHIGNVKQLQELRSGWEKNGSKELAIWLGNSQLHGINQFYKGQQNCVFFAYQALDTSNRTVFGLSFPNANLQELQLAAIYANGFMNKVSTLIIPVFFDDMREDGIRSEITSDAVRNWLEQSPDSSYLANLTALSDMMKADKSSGTVENIDMKALDKTAQESSEKFIDSLLQSTWNIWARRPDIRGNIFNDLYLLRNKVLGIKATSVRKKIPARYKNNYEAFLRLLNYSKDKGIRVIVYIPPIRNDVDLPYNREEYTQFKSDIKRDSEIFGVRYINLEKLVPAEYWGEKASTSGKEETEIDFMHFRETGHKLIADTIVKTLNQLEDDL